MASKSLSTRSLSTVFPFRRCRTLNHELLDERQMTCSSIYLNSAFAIFNLLNDCYVEKKLKIYFSIWLINTAFNLYQEIAMHQNVSNLGLFNK
ncbi:hypothetical protein CEXT_451331 [Caerostris extrusa]|uniref:Uncharacterized protein n=1 Tax=Caerostris extrusa TaxID=172846 RepID=A0AAV4RUR0_CAEEX|nr:hypothetical protein CEXT_451331 [Caerostris extrusa]